MSEIAFVKLNFMVETNIIIIMSAFMLISLCNGIDLADVAMKQPGIDLAKSNLDSNSYMVALQPSTSATNDDLKNAIAILAASFGKEANATGYEGKLQIGITDRPGRVRFMLEIGASEAIAHVNDTAWLAQLASRGSVFQDDTRNYDPYGNRYTPIPDGKGLLGSMVLPWLGYRTYGADVWFAS